VHAALCDRLRRGAGLAVLDLSIADLGRADLLPTFLQSDVDVHGSHGLFYWLRARGSGTLVTSHDAGMMLTWRPDVGWLAAVRPVGQLDAVLALLDAAAASAPADVAFVVRYCAEEVVARLRERGWTGMRSPWRPDAPADDETFPEVIVTAPVVDLPSGQRYKPVREAISRHHGAYAYRASAAPLGIGEARFIQRDAARAGGYDEHEAGFNAAVLATLDAARHDWLTYHYLTWGQRLAGFAITANITGIAHGYYLSTLEEPRLTTFFLWHIYLQQRRAGAFALNLGGSEAASLYDFKTHTFPEHILQHTTVLQRPTSPTHGR
jgi:hypothetical protein